MGEDIVHGFTKVKLFWRNYCSTYLSKSLFSSILRFSTLSPIKLINSLSEKKDSNKTVPDFTPEHKGVLVGLLLADGFIEKRKPSHSARLRVDHSYPGQESYVRKLYSIFQPFCGTEPAIHIRKPDKRTKKVYRSMSFKTYNLALFNPYHELFYRNSGELLKKGYIRYKKVIPSNIKEFLTPLALAH